MDEETKTPEEGTVEETSEAVETPETESGVEEGDNKTEETAV